MTAFYEANFFALTEAYQLQFIESSIDYKSPQTLRLNWHF